ncbi:hypothetical protein RB195_011497 [Necator americanus]|uniref:C2H2-type domain-containing protein n=1 Tax=Necator americanus TaxID=51031 RepID=A0ABR1D3T0_NECAM
MRETLELQKCPLCVNLFTPTTLILHLKRRHGDAGKEQAERLRRSQIHAKESTSREGKGYFKQQHSADDDEELHASSLLYSNADRLFGDKLHEREKMRTDSIYYKCDFCLFSCFTRAVLETHVQTYHPRAQSECERQLPSSSPVTCPTCRKTFKTRYLLSVHCVGVHTTAMTDFTLIQTSFNSWAQFEPWRTMMERDTKTVLIKSEMQAWNTKLIHSYHCQFDHTAAPCSKKEKKDKKCTNDEENRKSSNCPAFIKVMENEDGVLDCVACFGHLGHEMDGLPPISSVGSAELMQDEAENDKDGDLAPCFLCGGVSPPEIDAKTCEDVKWCCCSETECGILAHEWCTQLLGKKCPECEKGILISG